MTPETFCQHFATFAEAPNGVAKLRELILQLAVQGKLLPQDANDEPAATLLKRVRQARNKTNGRPEKLRGIYQQQAKLPGGWEWFQLNELGEFCGGGTPSMRQSEYWNGKIPWVSPKDMKVSHITSSELRFTDAALKGTRIRLIPRKSILVVARSGILKRTLPVAINEVECTVNQDLKVLIPFLPELSEYIRLMLRGHESMILATLIKGGVTVQSLKYEEFEIQPFPFPPIAEQRRIVEKVDQLLGQCDELAARQAARREARSALVGATLDRLVSARSSAEFPAHAHRLRDNFDRLFDTPTTIPQLRQAILQLAVQGQLVPQDPNDEPASVLITRIVAQKAQLIRDKNIRNSNSHTSRDAGAETDVLPNGWSWVTLDAITEIGTGGPPPTGTKEYYKVFRDSQSVSRSDTATDEQYRHEKCTSISTQWIAPHEWSAICIVADKTTRILRGLLCRMLQGDD